MVEVIDDETVKVKKMFSKDKIVSDLKEAKSSIDNGGKGLTYKCLPYIDQTKVSLEVSSDASCHTNIGTCIYRCTLPSTRSLAMVAASVYSQKVSLCQVFCDA